MSLCREADSAEAAPVKNHHFSSSEVQKVNAEEQAEVLQHGKCKRGKVCQKCCLYLPLTLLEAH